MDEDKFIDPITLDVFVDPVLAEDGFFYDLLSIYNWFRKGKRVSPKNRMKIDTTLIRSFQFSKELNEYRQSQGLDVVKQDYYGLINLTEIEDILNEDLMLVLLAKIKGGDKSKIKELVEIYSSLDTYPRENFFFDYIMKEDIPELFNLAAEDEDIDYFVDRLIRNKQKKTLRYLLNNNKIGDEYIDKVRSFLGAMS